MNAESELLAMRARLQMYEQCEEDKNYFSQYRDAYTVMKLIDFGHAKNDQLCYEDLRGDYVPIFSTSLNEIGSFTRDVPYMLKVTIGADELSGFQKMLEKEEIVAVQLKVKQQCFSWKEDLEKFMKAVCKSELPLLVDVFDLTAAPSPLEVLQLLSGLYGDLPLLFPASPKLLKLGADKDVRNMIMGANLVITEESCRTEMEPFLKAYPLNCMVVSSTAIDGVAEQISVDDLFSRLEASYSFLSDIKGLESDDIITIVAHNTIRLLPKLESGFADWFEPVEAEAEEEHDEPLQTIQNEPEEEPEHVDESHLNDTGYEENYDDSYEEDGEDEDGSDWNVGNENNGVENIQAMLQMCQQGDQESSEDEFEPGYPVDDYDQGYIEHITSKTAKVRNNLQPTGEYQDINGRWHDARGRFCRDPTKQYANEAVTRKGKSNTQTSSVATSSGVRRNQQPTGEYQDINGRWHDSTGKFCKDPRNKNANETSATTPKKKSATHTAASKPSEGIRREITADGYYKDRNNHWHGPDGKFCKDPTLSGGPLTSTPKRTGRPAIENSASPIKTVSSNSVRQNVQPGGEYKDRNGRWHDASGKFCSDPTTSTSGVIRSAVPSRASSNISAASTKTIGSTVNESIKSCVQPGGEYLDRNGKWHSSNGKFCKDPRITSSTLESYSRNTTTSVASVKSPSVTKPVSQLSAPSTRTNVQAGGQYQDRQGRWHDASGKYCKDPNAPVVVVRQAPTQRVATPRRASPIRVSQPTVQRSTRSDGAYQDVNGRWHGSNGRFIKAPTNVSQTPSRSYGTASSFGGGGGGMSSSSSSSFNGCSQDRNGRWHGTDGRFCKNPYG